jgi:hypothetical protein
MQEIWSRVLLQATKNVNCLQDEKAENGSGYIKAKSEGSFVSRPIEPECETKRVPLDPKVPDKAVMISQDLSANKKAELLSFLDRNSDVFIVIEKTRPGSFRFADNEGRVLEHFWNADNVRRFYI